MINSFDIDGVIFMDKYDGVYPGKDDIIITGRSTEEQPETEAMLKSKGITHKGHTLLYLEQMGMRFGIHYEDDPVQAEIIRKIMPHINVVLLQHELVEKENKKHECNYTRDTEEDGDFGNNLENFLGG